MTTIAWLYVDPPSVRAAEGRGAVHQQARLLACRTYAAARGYAVQEAFVAGQESRMALPQALLSLLERVQAGLAHPPSVQQAVVVYDLGAWQNEAGGADPLVDLLHASGVRLEGALPPHTLPAARRPDAGVLRGVLHGLFSIEPAGRLLPVEPLTPAVLPAGAWQGLLDLLEDEGRLRDLAAVRPQGTAGREDLRRQLDAAREQEREIERRMGELLDGLLEGRLEKAHVSAAWAGLETELRSQRVERRRAHALLAGGPFPPALVEQAVVSARCLRRVLEGLSAEEAARAAGSLHVRAEAGGWTGLLPLVDDPARSTARWSARGARGRNTPAMETPPGGPDAHPEDYPLAWAAVKEPCSVIFQVAPGAQEAAA